MNMYELTVPQFINILTQVGRWLDKAQAYAEQKNFSPDVLLNARLAPDQFPFTRQVQILSDTTKNGSARLAGVEPPKFEDNETTLDEVRARITKTIEYLNTFKPEQFQGAAERTITIPLRGTSKKMVGSEFLVQFSLPNMYFHATTAYAILRHNGVDLGKGDFLGTVAFRDA
jgi:hypothetical protein